ncbi:MAG: succinyl-CoA--3-ketoacid-CoA transferase [Chloroflexi bacterium]|nr:succinyl-CoA--3-ketoacid-CoA transferase [Chloroflexota bacterium]
MKFHLDPAPRLNKNQIAKIATKFLKNNSLINLGIGIPSLCAQFIKDPTILLHAENGVYGFNKFASEENINTDIMDAGGNFLDMNKNMVFFDSVESFNLIRGGHIDTTILGAFQVSKSGDIANWIIPKRGIGSIGGAMDLCANTKEIIVTMEHTTKKNESKIVDKCVFPLTAVSCVNKIITDVGIFELDNNSLLLKECAPGWDPITIQKITDVTIEYDEKIIFMDIDDV